MLRTLRIVAIFLLASHAFAWNSFGHMAVGWVAYQHLNPDTKAAVNKLIAQNPSYQKWKSALPSGLSSDDQSLYLFMIATTWPDQIKSDSSYQNDGPDGGNTPPATGATTNIGYSDKARHKYWHFIDEPFSPDHTALPPIPYPSAETEIAVFRQTLESSQATPPLQSYDLVWLLHLMGDIHQPLHCAARFTNTRPKGDSGGNGVKFCPVSDQSCSSNLHAFWDDLLGPFDGTPQQVAAVAAALAPVTVSPNDLDVHTWVEESFQLAQSAVYVNPPIQNGAGPYFYDETYTKNALAIAQKRVVQAGLRLANILNTEIK
jgi:hypothetical protein